MTKIGKKTRIIRNALTKVEGKEGGFVIFTHPGTKRFIQYAASKERGFPVDIPVGGNNQLTDDEIHKLESLGFETGIIHYDEVDILTELQGIGLEKVYGLITHFGGLEEIIEASRKRLQEVPGISEETAGRIINSAPKFKQLISNAKSRGDYSLTKECDLSDAVDPTKRFFREICSLPEDYEVEIESYLGEEKCSLCGGIVKGSEVKASEVSIES